MRRDLLELHALHLLAPALLLGLSDGLIGQIAGAVLLFFGAFNLLHDAMHGALGLPRPYNDLVLACAGALVGVSGHAARMAHLRHHRRPLADDDLEGRGARVSAGRALLLGPASYLGLLDLSGRVRSPRLRAWVVGEWAAVVCLGVGSAGSASGVVWVLIVAIAQLSIPLWAGHLPHRPPEGLVRLARALVWTRSPVVLGFLHHQRHHDAPGVSCFELGRAPSTCSAARPSMAEGACRGSRSVDLRVPLGAGVVDVHRLPLAEEVDGRLAHLPLAHAGGLQAAERELGLSAHGG